MAIVENIVKTSRTLVKKSTVWNFIRKTATVSGLDYIETLTDEPNHPNDSANFLQIKGTISLNVDPVDLDSTHYLKWGPRSDPTNTNLNFMASGSEWVMSSNYRVLSAVGALSTTLQISESDFDSPIEDQIGNSVLEGLNIYSYSSSSLSWQYALGIEIEIIRRWEMYVDDTSEFSTGELWEENPW